MRKSVHALYEQQRCRSACTSGTDTEGTVKILSCRTDMPGQTVQTQIGLLLEEQSDQGLHCLPFLCIVWTHYSMVEPYSLNFRVITKNFLGVRIFRKFTVFEDN